MPYLLLVVFTLLIVMLPTNRTHAAIREGKSIAIQAHRGYSGRYPENTMLAFEKAIEAGADQIELDIRCTKDGSVFVIHDDKVDRTTNGTGRVCDLTAKDMRVLDAGAWFSPEFAGELVPSFPSVLDQLRGRGRLNIEVKVNGTPLDMVRTAIDGALQAVQDRDMFDQVIFSSFSLDALYWVNRLQSRAVVALLDWDRETHLDRQQTVLAMQGHGWLPHPAMATPARVSQAHQRGLFVISGGGNDPATRRESVSALVHAGVDTISTNFPAEVIATLAELS